MKKHIIIFVALISLLSVLCAAAPIAGTPEARSMYSSRPYRRPVPARQYIVEDVIVEPTVAPEVPAEILDPPLDPRNMRSLTAPVPPSTRAVVPVPVYRGTRTVIDDRAVTERPLSSIAVGKPSKPETASKAEEPILELKTVPVKKKESTNVTDTSVFTSGSAVDKLYVRLAKIQLEKKNLPETLRFIDKISSPMFKVATLVEFAEYVSRDSDYRREAEQLYSLAISGIEALQDGKPVIVLVPASQLPSSEPVKQAEQIEEWKPPVKPEAPKKEFTLIPEEPEDEPAPKPAEEQPKIEPVKPQPAVEPPVVLPEPKPPVKEEPQPVVEPVLPEPKPENMPAVKPSILEPLDDTETVKEMPKEPVLAPEPAAEPKQEELPKEEPKPVRKPSFIVSSGSDKAESKPAESKAEPKTETAPAKTEEPAAEAKPARRPLPKKTVKLEEN